jgi:hypothetical protein
VENQMHVLQHASLWQMPEIPAVMALKMEIAQQKQGHKQLDILFVAHLTRFNNHHQDQGQHGYQRDHGQNGYQYPSWMITGPKSQAETSKAVNGKIYVWCTKCRQGKGLLVCTYNDKTHQQDFQQEKSQDRNQQQRHRRPQPHHRSGPPIVPPPSFPTPPAPHGQLPLLDYIKNSFNQDGANPFADSPNDAAEDHLQDSNNLD